MSSPSLGEFRISLIVTQGHLSSTSLCCAGAWLRCWRTKPATGCLGIQLQPQRSYSLSPRRPDLVTPAHVERPPLHRGGSVSRGDQARPVLPPLPKPLSDKNRKGVCRTLDCARPTRAFSEVIGASWRTGGGRVRRYALREQESLAAAIPDLPALLDYSIFQMFFQLRRKKVGHSEFQRCLRNVPAR